MASIREISEPQLFMGLDRSADATSSSGVSKILEEAEARVGCCIHGLFSCRDTGLYIGARAFDGVNLLKQTAMSRIAAGMDGFSDQFVSVGMVGHVAGLFVRDTLQSVDDLEPENLFGDKVAGAPPPALQSSIPEEKLTETVNGLPAVDLLGVCDKLKWIHANDANGDSLWVDWVFGPGWLAVGATVADGTGKAVVAFTPVRIALHRAGADFYARVGQLCNAVAGNALSWMLQQAG